MESSATSVPKYLVANNDQELRDVIVGGLSMGNAFAPRKGESDAMMVVLPNASNSFRLSLINMVDSDPDDAVKHFNSMIFRKGATSSLSGVTGTLVNELGQEVLITNSGGKTYLNKARLVSDQAITLKSTPPIYLYFTDSGEIGINNKEADMTGGLVIETSKGSVDALYANALRLSQLSYCGGRGNPVAELVLSIISWGKQNELLASFLNRIKPMPEPTFVGLYAYFEQNPGMYTKWAEDTGGLYVSKLENIHEEYLRVYGSLYTMVAAADKKQQVPDSTLATGSKVDITKAIKAAYADRAYDLFSDEAAIIGLGNLQELVYCETDPKYAYNRGGPYEPMSTFLYESIKTRFPKDNKDLDSTISGRTATHPLDPVTVYLSTAHVLARSDLFRYSPVNPEVAASAPEELKFVSGSRVVSDRVSIAGMLYNLQKKRVAVNVKAQLPEVVYNKLKTFS